MTKAAALYAFFNSFGWTAYAVEDVPEDADFPYLTYELSTGAFGDETSPTVELWHHSESNVPINRKAQEISDKCKNGAYITYDGGGAIVYCGTWQALRDEVDAHIKRRRSNFTIQWISLT